jgi:2-amino-4-hydroxy-6-hydroxymethyldihydropteridine diphosphokinase
LAPETVRAFIALGSNLGDRLANLQRAVELLESRGGIRLLRASRVYETDPVGPPQPDYLNAVLEVETPLPPGRLLEEAQAVEGELGRVRGERWGPRVIDVDLLTYGDEHVDEPGLEIPHPRMHERAFVLVPLLELTADPRLPGGRRLSEVRLPPDMLGGVRLFGPALGVGERSPQRSCRG